MVLAPEPSGFPDDIAQPIGELRVRLFTTHFASFCAAAFPHEASSERENCAVTVSCAVSIICIHGSRVVPRIGKHNRRRGLALRILRRCRTEGYFGRVSRKALISRSTSASLERN